MIKEKELFTTVKPELVIGQLFQSRDMMHITHLQTVNYAEHKALNSFYDDLLDLADQFIETYQGQYGIVTGYESLNISKEDDIIKYLENFAETVKSNRKNLENDDTHLQNILDEIIGLTYQTIYKLRFLK